LNYFSRFVFEIQFDISSFYRIIKCKRMFACGHNTCANDLFHYVGAGRAQLITSKQTLSLLVVLSVSITTCY